MQSPVFLYHHFISTSISLAGFSHLIINVNGLLDILDKTFWKGLIYSLQTTVIQNEDATEILSGCCKISPD
jgi:hypothetical protein